MDSSAERGVKRLAGFVVWNLVFTVPGAALLFFSADARLDCTRSEQWSVDCELQHVSFFGNVPIERIAVQDLKQAWLDSATDVPDLGGRTRGLETTTVDWVTLATADRQLPLTRVGTEGTGLELVTKIESFLVDPDARALSVQQEIAGRWKALRIVGYVLFLLGVPTLLWPVEIAIRALRAGGAAAPASDSATEPSIREMVTAAGVVLLVALAVAAVLWFAYRDHTSPQQSSFWEQVRDPDRLLALEIPRSASTEARSTWLDCRRGNLSRCTDLGWRLVRELGEPAAYDAAESAFSLVCDEGDADGCEALYELGVRFADGEGIERDPVRSRRLLEAACAQRVEGACSRLQQEASPG